MGQLAHAEPVFAPAARVPLAGLLLAIPALEATGLLSCATTVFGQLRKEFYSLDTMLLEGVLRALAGEPRAEGATATTALKDSLRPTRLSIDPTIRGPEGTQIREVGNAGWSAKKPASGGTRPVLLSALTMLRPHGRTRRL